MSLSLQAHASEMKSLHGTDQRLKRSEELTAFIEAELLDKKIPFDNNDEIEELFADKRTVLRLASYLARTVDYDIHWSYNICKALFTESYLKEHLWPAKTLVTNCCKNVMRM